MKDRLTAAASVPGDVLRDEVIAPREYTSFTMRRTNVLRIIDLEGQQVPDVIAFNLEDLEESLSTGFTTHVLGTYNPTEGHVLYSDNVRPMFSIAKDTVGRNYPSPVECSDELNFVRYGVPGTRNCRDNLAMAIRAWGLSWRDVPGAFAPFMNVVHDQEGGWRIEEPPSKPGDHIDLRAEMDLLVAISNCPQERNPCNGFNPTPLRTIVYHSSEVNG
jgi:uncharacterized protein